jgi:hypothetical protein
MDKGSADYTDFTNHASVICENLCNPWTMVKNGFNAGLRGIGEGYQNGVREARG